jgi:hypothetical protein
MEEEYSSHHDELNESKLWPLTSALAANSHAPQTGVPSFYSGRERRISYEGEKLVFYGGNHNHHLAAETVDEAHILEGVVCGGA